MMGVGSILLIGPISRSEGLSPHRVSENVFWPLIVHSHIWLFDSIGGAAAVCICAAGKVGAGVGAVGTPASGNATTAFGNATTAFGDASASGNSNACASGDI